MCKIKSIDTMTREEQEAAYEHALGISLGSMAMEYYHNTTIKPTNQCPHCGVYITGEVYNHHINTCILSKISIEEFISEYTNPTMPRKEFLKKYNKRGSYNYLVRRFIIAGLIPSDIKEGDVTKFAHYYAYKIPPNKCKYCGITTGNSRPHHHRQHEKTCVFSKLSLDDFISEYTNPTISRRQVAKKYGGNRVLLHKVFKTLNDAGRIPSDSTLHRKVGRRYNN